MTHEATLDDFASRNSSGESRSPALEERLLNLISSTVGLRLIPGRGDPLYLQNRGTERYLFYDEHDRWFILQPSAKESEDAFVRWVYLPEDRPERLARSALRRRTVIGYEYVRWAAAPDPVRSTVTAMFVTERWPDTTYECGSCEARFDSALNHALHCWESIRGCRIPHRYVGEIRPTSESESRGQLRGALRRLTNDSRDSCKAVG